MTQEIMQVTGLKKYFPVGRKSIMGKSQKILKAVDEVSLSIRAGETFGLVGESGCGKSTLGRCLIRLIEPDEGQILYAGNDITRLKPEELLLLRRKLQIVFQNPFASFNPKRTMRSAFMEILKVHRLYKGNEMDRIHQLLEITGLPEGILDRRSNELSGGQLQRLAIARALLLEPEFIVADEPVSALDVSVQAQILNLMLDLKNRLGLTMLFVSHDLTIVEHLCDRVAVMYLGRIVETAGTDELFENMRHPYTKALMAAIPETDPDKKRERILLEADLPDAIDMPAGCRFASRCSQCAAVCMETEPQLKEVSPGHQVACHFAMDYIK
jgi:oligopeptide/dipeptide ABC transporter ATP-binding protein